MGIKRFRFPDSPTIKSNTYMLLVKVGNEFLNPVKVKEGEFEKMSVQ
jgi:hypothetical protein